MPETDKMCEKERLIVRYCNLFGKFVVSVENYCKQEKMNKKLLGMLLLGAASMCSTVEAQRITILSANDTHSAVLPTNDGMGGLLRQKVLVDSVRRADENVVAVHAGDAVQGTVYFSMFRGEIEYALHDSIGYDYCVLGNH